MNTVNVVPLKLVGCIAVCITMSLRSLVTLCVVLLSGSYAQSKLHLCVVMMRQFSSQSVMHVASCMLVATLQMHEQWLSLLTLIRAFSSTFGQP